MYLLGFDIGGTKSAVITAEWDGEALTLLKTKSCPTDHTVPAEEMIARLISFADSILEKTPDKIGISSGGPLDSERGVIMSPPNLPGWDNIYIVKQIEAHFGVTPKLENDANASAVAEWKFGAGRGARNMVFLTFGTGLGAGLILDGKLYRGANGNAGEVGHIRLDPTGPVGYGKAGSFEGFCSGGGIARLGLSLAEKEIKKGNAALYYKMGDPPESVTAKSIAEAAYKGDPTALEVYKICGEHLGRGLSVIIDILNPEVIVIGSVFTRSRDLLWHHAERLIGEEALSQASVCCTVKPAELSENIGNYAALAAAVL